MTTFYVETLKPWLMSTAYNRIAGQSVERLAALSDGIFAFAMTLLVLDLRVPAMEAVHNERDLWHALTALSPRLVMYMMSFMTLGIFWVGQQTQLNHLERSNIRLSWIHIAFLFFVSITPFSTALLAEYTRYRIALVSYCLNIVCLGSALYLSWGCATRSRLLKTDIPADVPRAVCAESSLHNACTDSVPCSLLSAPIGASRSSSWSSSTTRSHHVLAVDRSLEPNNPRQNSRARLSRVGNSVTKYPCRFSNSLVA
jgi:uncharacterized membrane protein